MVLDDEVTGIYSQLFLVLPMTVFLKVNLVYAFSTALDFITSVEM